MDHGGSDLVDYINQQTKLIEHNLNKDLDAIVHESAIGTDVHAHAPRVESPSVRLVTASKGSHTQILSERSYFSAWKKRTSKRRTSKKHRIAPHRPNETLLPPDSAKGEMQAKDPRPIDDELVAKLHSELNVLNDQLLGWKRNGKVQSKVEEIASETINPPENTIPDPIATPVVEDTEIKKEEAEESRLPTERERELISYISEPKPTQSRLKQKKSRLRMHSNRFQHARSQQQTRRPIPLPVRSKPQRTASDTKIAVNQSGMSTSNGESMWFKNIVSISVDFDQIRRKYRFRTYNQLGQQLVAGFSSFGKRNHWVIKTLHAIRYEGILRVQSALSQMHVNSRLRIKINPQNVSQPVPENGDADLERNPRSEADPLGGTIRRHATAENTGKLEMLSASPKEKSSPSKSPRGEHWLDKALARRALHREGSKAAPQPVSRSIHGTHDRSIHGTMAGHVRNPEEIKRTAVAGNMLLRMGKEGNHFQIHRLRQYPQRYNAPTRY